MNLLIGKTDIVVSKQLSDKHFSASLQSDLFLYLCDFQKEIVLSLNTMVPFQAYITVMRVI